MKNYIKILFLSIFFFFSQKSYAQELPIYSQYMFNEYLINAAYGGTYFFTPVIINHRNQWVGFGDSAPQTSSLSIHSSLGKNNALGSSMIYDKTHPISRTQLQLSYGQHIILNRRNNIGLSIALSGTWNMWQYTQENNTTYSEIMNGTMDYIIQGNETGSSADMNFGMILFSNRFDLGLSIRNLLSPEPLNTTTEDKIERVKYILIHGSYLSGTGQSPIGFIPSFVIRKMGVTTYNSLFEIDINMKLVYKNKIWTGVSYRTHEKTISTLLGFNTPKAFFGYSYDIGASTNLGSYHNGSHNIAIGLKLSGKKQKAIRNQTPLYLDIDSQPKKIRIADMRNKSTI